MTQPTFPNYKKIKVTLYGPVLFVPTGALPPDIHGGFF